MIIVCELYRQEGAHVPVNAGMLEVIRLAFPDEEIVFFGDPVHVEDIRAQLGPEIASSILWKTIDPPGQNKSYFAMFMFAVKGLKQLARSFGQSKSKRLVVASIDSPAILLALKTLERSILKDVRIQVVVHGGLHSRAHWNPLLRIQEVRTALSLFPRSKIQYLTLEHSVGKRILQTLPSLNGKIEVLEHPVPPNERNFSMRELGEPIRFGFLGQATKKKGFPLFLELAEHISKKYPAKSEFHFIGWLESDEQSKPQLQWLATKPSTDRLQRDEFVQQLQRLHYVLMPYEQYYELSPSGTLLDAITWQVPIIATRLPIFESTFEVAGDIGHLFNNEIELYSTVEHIVEGLDACRYRTQLANLRNAYASRTPDTLALQYRRICAQGALKGNTVCAELSA